MNRWIPPAQKVVTYSFTDEEMAELMRKEEFTLVLSTVKTMEEGEALVRAGNRFLLEAKGIKRPVLFQL